jgi:hypothetical protein
MSAHEGSTNHHVPPGTTPIHTDRIGVAVNWFGSLLRPTKASATMDPQAAQADQAELPQVLHATQLASPGPSQTAQSMQVESPVLQTAVTPGTVVPFLGPTLPPVESPVESPVLHVRSPVSLPVRTEPWNDVTGVGSRYVPPDEFESPLLSNKNKKPPAKKAPAAAKKPPAAKKARKKKASKKAPPPVVPQVEPPVELPVEPPVQVPDVEPAGVVAARLILESFSPAEMEEVLNTEDAAAKEATAVDVSASATNNPKASRKPVKTTSQAAKKERGRKMKHGVRIKIQRKRLYPICATDDQRDALPTDDPDCAFYYGTVMAGTSQKGYTVQFDVLPEMNNVIEKVRRALLFVLVDGEDEPLMDYKLQALLDAELAAKREAGKTPETKDEDFFVKQDIDTLKTTNILQVKYSKDENPIEWTILGDGEHLRGDAKYTKLKKRSQPSLSEVDFSLAPHENFFKHVWPDMTGTAKIIDEYLSDSRAAFHNTACDDNIKFDDPTALDPDWKVKQCLLALIAASSEIEDGFACWTSGQGPGRKSLPDFGKWVALNEMKCFVSTAKWIFAERKWWYREARDIAWDMFLPMIHKWNACRVKLLVAFLLILDESMSGWRPKNSKSGGLPNISFEPRKPVPLGTMLRDAAECVTGIMMYVDPVLCPERQNFKEFHDEENIVPQVQGSSVPNGVSTCSMSPSFAFLFAFFCILVSEYRFNIVFFRILVSHVRLLCHVTHDVKRNFRYMYKKHFAR